MTREVYAGAERMLVPESRYRLLAPMTMIALAGGLTDWSLDNIRVIGADAQTGKVAPDQGDIGMKFLSSCP